MNYTEATEYIQLKNKLGIVPGLSNMTELLKRMGNPQNRCRCLHIAGTNGKGSVFSFVENALLDAGYKVGRYISPTIKEYLERFQINKEMMPCDIFAEYIGQIANVIDSMEKNGFKSPTAFEIETAVAYMYFADSKVDFALIECGMGGTMDATNVLDKPFAAVFSRISMDHMQFLGDNVADIARNKAGIIKGGCFCISSPQEEVVRKVLQEVADEKNADIVFADENRIISKNMTINGTEFEYSFGDSSYRYKIRMLGEHQVINAITAIELLKKIDGVSDKNIYNGLFSTIWPGRLTKICDKPPVYVDGAHNEEAWESLKKAVNYYFTNKKITYIIGVLRDKEYDKMVRILCNTMSAAVCITPDTPRGLDKDILKDCLTASGVDALTADSCHEALSMAKAMPESEVIIVCGSLSFLDEFLT